MEPEGSLPHSQVFLGRTKLSVQVRVSCKHFVTAIIIYIYMCVCVCSSNTSTDVQMCWTNIYILW